jgi:hypothetical protein
MDVITGAAGRNGIMDVVTGAIGKYIYCETTVKSRMSILVSHCTVNSIITELQIFKVWCLVYAVGAF